MSGSSSCRVVARSAAAIVDSLESRVLLTIIQDSDFLFNGTRQELHYELDTADSEAEQLFQNAFSLFDLARGSLIDRASIALDFNLTAQTATYTWGTLPNRSLDAGHYEAIIEQDGNNDWIPESHVSQFAFYPGDFNGNLAVDFADLLIIAQNNGLTSGATFAKGDANYDGAVNFDDLLILAQRYGGSLAPLPAGANALAVGSPTNNALTLNWTAPFDQRFNGFHVWRSENGLDFTKLPGVDVLRDDGQDYYSFTDTTVTDGTKYWYRVRPYNSTHSGVPTGYWNSTNKAQDITTMKVPTGFSASIPDPVGNPYRIKLEWTATSDSATSYLVEIDDNNDGIFNSAPYASISTSGPGAKTAYLDHAYEGTSFKLRIKGYNSANGQQSIPSSSSALIQVSSQMRAPTEVKAARVGPNLHAITWRDNSGTEESYEVQATTDGINYFSTPTTPPTPSNPSEPTGLRGIVIHDSTPFVGFRIASVKTVNSAPVRSAYVNIGINSSPSLSRTIVTRTYPGESSIFTFSRLPGRGPALTIIDNSLWYADSATSATSFSRNLLGDNAWMVLVDFDLTGNPSYRAYVTNGDFKDLDADELLGATETVIGTSPNDFDSDDDLLPDGWEFQSGLNPTDSDENDNSIIDTSEDFDGDSLGNLTESNHNTNPTSPDTDGDTVADGIEISQGSNPLDSTDSGQAPPIDMKSNMRLTVGDNSGSQSERWALQVGDRRHTSPGFGQVSSGDFIFEAGKSFPVRLIHLGSNLSTPDYDWTASIAPISPTLPYFVIDDTPSILGTYSPSTSNPVANKISYLHVPMVDLDLDSDNDGIVAGSRAEDELERTAAGAKVVVASKGDFDNDDIVDNADMEITGGSFTPMSISLSSNVADAQPSSISVNVSYNSSLVRVWKKDANDPGRSLSSVLAPGVHAASSLGLTAGGTVPFYVEAIAGSATPTTISVSVSVVGSRWTGAITDLAYIAPVVFDVQLSKANVGANGNEFTGTLTEAEEDQVGAGAFLPLNDDDDDYDAQNKPDHQQNGPIAGEDDLLPVLVKAVDGGGALPGHQRVLPPTGVKLWRNANKTQAVTFQTNLPLNADTQLYAEGTAAASSRIKVIYVINAQGQIDNAVGSDSARITVFKWNGARNVPEHGKYTYNVTNVNALPATTQWIAPTKGQFVGAAGKEVDIRWDAGPAVGRAKLQIDNNYTWGLGVNIVQIEVTAAPGGQPFTGGNVFDGGLYVGGATKRVVSGNPGMSVAAKVTLNGPSGDRGLRQIRVGFIQNVTVAEHRGVYANGKTLKSDMEGNTYWDTASTTSKFFGTDPASGQFNDAVPITKKEKVITAEDSPSGGPPKSDPSSSPLTSMNLRWTFDLYVAAQSKEAPINNSDKVFVAQATGRWNFVGSGDIDHLSANRDWTAATNAGVTGFANWTEQNNGFEPLTTGQTANAAGNATKWEEP